MSNLRRCLFERGSLAAAVTVRCTLNSPDRAEADPFHFPFALPCLLVQAKAFCAFRAAPSFGEERRQRTRCCDCWNFFSFGACALTQVPIDNMHPRNNSCSNHHRPQPMPKQVYSSIGQISAAKGQVSLLFQLLVIVVVEPIWRWPVPGAVIGLRREGLVRSSVHHCTPCPPSNLMTLNALTQAQLSPSSLVAFQAPVVRTCWP